MRAGLPWAEIPSAARDRLPDLAQWGLVSLGTNVVLTQRGRLMADAVVRELLTAAERPVA
jgi:hypothetical protein